MHGEAASPQVAHSSLSGLAFGGQGISHDASGPADKTLSAGPAGPAQRTWWEGSLASTSARDTAGAMSEENVEILRRAMPESAPANPENLFSILDENVEWDYVGAFPEIQTAHGPAEVREFLREWSEAFDDFSFRAEEMVDAGDAVVVEVRQSGRGKETGAQVEGHAWQVFTLRNGKVVHCRGYETKAQALEAAGLSE
jgi:ketosteroid isomerase-like protein